MKPQNNTFHNLPPLPNPDDQFYGRNDDIDNIIKLFGNDSRFINIYGEGGVGKTALALRVAHKLREQNIFNAVVWTTPKRYELDIKQRKRNILFGLFSYEESEINQIDVSEIRSSEGVWTDSIRNLFYTILSVSNYFVRKEKHNLSISYREVHAWMEENKTLLIVDDRESWNHEIFSFIEKIPSKNAVLITSRRLIKESFLPDVVNYDLKPLSRISAFYLIDKLLKRFNLDLPGELQEDIFDYASGNPLLIHLTISLLASNTFTSIKIFWIFEISHKKDEKTILYKIIDELRRSSEAQQFLFNSLYNRLTPDTKTVLFSIALLRQRILEPTIQDIEALTTISSEVILKIANELSYWSLIELYDTPNGSTSFDIHEHILNYTLLTEHTEEDDEIQKRINKIKEEFEASF